MHSDRNSPSPSQAPVLSIVIPCYNATATVVETVQSALRQGGVQAEVIVVDDGSSDNPEGVLRQAGLLDTIRFVRQQNQGVSVARNEGLRLARGEYICFLDSDDVLDPRFGLEMVSLLRRRRCPMGYCNYRYFANEPGYPEVNLRYPIHEGRVLGTILSENFIPTPGAVVMERSLVSQIGFDPKRRGTEDWWLWMQLLARHPICFHSDVLVAIRVLPQSLGRRREAMIRDIIGLFRGAERLVADAGIELTSGERAGFYYQFASVLLRGEQTREALGHWMQATRMGLDVKRHALFIVKLVLTVMGAQRLVERALWERRMKQVDEASR